MKKIKKLPKYEFGTLIEDPATDLYNNQLAILRAQNKANNNPLAKGVNLFGNLAGKVGSSLIAKGAANGEGAGEEGINGFFNKNSGDIQSGLNLLSLFGNAFAYGGAVPGVPVEVEGKEVAETPMGNLMEFFGASHEKGGIDVNLPAGTQVFSDRIKIDDVSMADRKKIRERNANKAQRLLDKTPNDKILVNSLQRVNEVNDIEENADNAIQRTIKQVMGNVQQHAYGDTVYGPSQYPLPVNDFRNNFGELGDIIGQFFLPPLTKEEPDPNYIPNLGTTVSTPADGDPNAFNNVANKGTGLADLLGGLTFGDALGLSGNLISTFGPMKNTKAARAGDTPNINAFKDFGKDGLKTLDTSKKYIEETRAEALKDLELARTGSKRRNRNSARGINTLRALDLATDAQVNDNQGDIYTAFANQMMNVLSQQAGMENQQDQVVMSGEQAKDLADRQDRDNYFTQLAQDIATKGYGLQETGKDINQMKERDVMMNLLNQLSAYGITIDSKGNLSSKKK